jgi:tetratricopeptide (TPR) repeat protein
MDAYDWFVQGRELFHNSTSEDNLRACEIFEKVVSLDPSYAAAHALLAESYIRDWITFWDQPLESSYDRAWEAAKQALALNDTDSRCQTTIAIAYLFSGDHEQAQFRLTRALSLNPCDTHAITYMSRYEMYLGNAERSIELINEARHFDPFGIYDWSLVTAYFVAQNYDEAIHLMRAIQNPAPTMLICMAAVYAQAGEIQNASELATKYVEIAKAKLDSIGAPSPDSWLNFVSQRWPFKHEEDREHFLDGLRKAGVPE